MEDVLSFGIWIKRRRKAMDLTQDDLARLVGCSHEMIRKIEGDARRPSRQIAALLADHLALPPEERDDFIRCARSELNVDHLPPPAQSAPRAAFLPAIHTDWQAEQPAQASLPGGTVTFLFTDIEGSTRLWEQHPRAMQDTLTRQESILRQAIESRGGVVFKTVGDAVCAAFASAPQALATALDAQRALHAEDWGAIASLRVRMALHTGTADLRAGDYAGFALSRIARILATGHGGQVLLSQATFELTRNHLPRGAELRDLGAHRLKDLTRPEQIFQLIALDMPAEFPPLRTLDTRSTNLPAQPTALIGREREIAEVCALLRRDDVRLLTLTGPGGTGKTRLALQAAAELALTPSPSPAAAGEGIKLVSPPLPSQWERGPGGEGHFPDGVWFVNLAPIADPGLIATTIAQALDVIEVAGKPVEERLRAFLRAKRMLLLLDNFEQVIDATPLVADLLAAAPGLKVLVTSRATLHLYGEHEFAVPPLALPPTTVQTFDTEITQYESVRLFIARGQAVKADFTVTNENAPAVAEICYRLDGLPLAIELAAARIKLFAPEALLARLGHSLEILTGGPRDLPARQQTLRNTIDWSYNLLDVSEQALFRRLGVFVDGCTAEAAEAVCGDRETGRPGDKEALPRQSPCLPVSLSVLDGLAALIDKSLLRQEEGPGGEPRFVMLETVRDYALEQLAANDELAPTQRRHAEYFLALAEAAEPALKGHSQAAWLNRLEGEFDNLRAAIDRWSEIQEAEMTARMDAALGLFWDLRDHQPEGIARLEAALTRRDKLSPAVRAKALAVAGRLLWRWDSLLNEQHARELCIESLALYRALEDTPGIASVLTDLGFGAVNLGDARTATPLLAEGLALFRAVDDEYGSAWALLWLGVAAHRQHDYPESEMRLRESLAYARAAGDQWCAAWALCFLAYNAHDQGDYAAARALHEERLAIEQALEHKQGIWASLMGLASLAETQQDYVTAHMYYEEGLGVLAGQAGDPSILDTLLHLGDLAFVQQDYSAAHAWYDRALALARDLDCKDFIAGALADLAGVAQEQGDDAQAIAYLAESLVLFRGIQHKWGIAYVLRALGYIAASQEDHAEAVIHFNASLAQHELETELGDRALCLAGLAAVAAAQGQLERAARLCGATVTVPRPFLSISPLDRIEYNRTIATIRAQLDDATFAAAWAAGQKLTLEQAIADALDGVA